MAVVRQQIAVRVAPDGSITAETRGITGEKCLDYIDVLEDLLDATTSESHFTEDYHRSHLTQEQEYRNELRHG